MTLHKETIARIERIAHLVRSELQGFQVYKFTKEPELGLFNIKMFGIRIKCVERVLADDLEYRVMELRDESDFNKDKLFLELASAGYIKWLRSRYSTHGFLSLLMQEDRAQKMVAAAKEKAKRDKKGDFLLKYLDSLRKRPLIEIYHEDPDIFDWMLL